MRTGEKRRDSKKECYLEGTNSISHLELMTYVFTRLKTNSFFSTNERRSGRKSAKKQPLRVFEPKIAVRRAPLRALCGARDNVNHPATCERESTPSIFPGLCAKLGFPLAQQRRKARAGGRLRRKEEKWTKRTSSA